MWSAGCAATCSFRSNICNIEHMETVWLMSRGRSRVPMATWDLSCCAFSSYSMISHVVEQMTRTTWQYEECLHKALVIMSVLPVLVIVLSSMTACKFYGSREYHGHKKPRIPYSAHRHGYVNASQCITAIAIMYSCQSKRCPPLLRRFSSTNLCHLTFHDARIWVW